MTSYVHPPYCRIGNKWQILKYIIPLIPDHKIYVELFTGSGAVFFNKSKVDVNVLNDLDPDIIDRLKMLSHASVDPKDYRSGLDTLPKIRHFFNHHSNSIEDKILLEKIKACNGYSGTYAHKSDAVYRVHDPSKIVNMMPYYQQMLKGVRFYKQDYKKTLKMYDSKDTFFYIDPPYEDTSKNMYKDSDFDYQSLADTLKTIKGMFMISVNDSPVIRRIFKGYVMRCVSLKSFIRDNTKRDELLIMNYKLE